MKKLLDKLKGWLGKKVAGLLLKWVENQIGDMKKSWKTTIMGIGILLVAVGSATVALLDGDPTTVVNIDAILAALAGLGLLAARDNDVTSEKAGAK